MKFKDNVPIYLQIEEYLYRQIVIGDIKAGDKIPSVRALAAELTVNVNTVQRALQKMNEQGILHTKRGEGNFVTKDKDLLAKTRQKLIENELQKFVDNMHEFKLDGEQLIELLVQYLKREK